MSILTFIKTIAAVVFPSTIIQRIIEYPEMCDPSAALAISDTLFIVASDEDNVLRVYARENPGAPQRFDLNSFLKPDEDYPEADIEGVTRIDDRIFWITRMRGTQMGSSDLAAIGSLQQRQRSRATK